MNSISSFYSAASRDLETSAYTEWSMTKSTGTKGFIFFGSPPNLADASLIAAKSTTAGTPVKSYNITLAGLNGISVPLVLFYYQFRIFSTSYCFTLKSSQFLTADSNKTLIE